LSLSVLRSMIPRNNFIAMIASFSFVIPPRFGFGYGSNVRLARAEPCRILFS
jgi:hypothetical protein